MKNLAGLLVIFSFLFPAFCGVEENLPYSTQAVIKIETMDEIIQWWGGREEVLNNLKKAGIDTTKSVTYFYLSFPPSYGFTAEVGSLSSLSALLGKKNEETYENVKISALNSPLMGCSYVFLTGKKVFFVTDLGGAKKIIRVIKGKESPLSSNSYFQQGMKQLKGGDIVGYVCFESILENFLPLIQILKKKGLEEEKEGLEKEIYEIQIEELLKQLQKIKFVVFSIVFEKKLMKVLKVTKLESDYIPPQGKISFSSYLPASSFLSLDFFLDLKERIKEAQNISSRLNKLLEKAGEEEKAKIRKMQQAHVGLLKSLSSAIYPEIGMGAFLNLPTPSFVIVGKVKDREKFYRAINDIFSIYLETGENIEIKDIPPFNYEGREIRGKEIIFKTEKMEKSQKLYFSADKIFFLVCFGDESILRAGWDVVLGKKPSLITRKDYSRLQKYLKSPAIGHFMISISSAISHLKNIPISTYTAGVGGLYWKEGYLISEVYWEREDLTKLRRDLFP